MFRNEQQEQKLCKLRDLIVLAYADGKFTEDEKLYVCFILSKEGIDINDLPKVLNDTSSVRDAYPNTEEDRVKYITQMVMLMIADGECSEREINFCEFIAMKLGFNSEFIYELVASLSLEMMKDDEEKAMQVVLSYIANGGNIGR